MIKKNNWLWDEALDDQLVRKELAKESHLLFFLLYLNSYITDPLAFFHYEMLRLVEDGTKKLVTIMAFRGSGKSTILNLSYILWAIFGKHQKKFVVIISKTRTQSQIHFDNLKREVEGNDLLRADFNLPKINQNSYSLTIPVTGTKIICVSIEQSIRGLRHGLYRPDLIICDDLEDLKLVDSPAERQKLRDWFKGEVMLAGSDSTNIIVLGNLLGEESLLMKLMGEANDSSFVFRAYPLLDDNKQVLWPEKFTNPAKIDDLKDLVADEETWEREYLLKAGVDLVIQGPWRGTEPFPGEDEALFRTITWKGITYKISPPSCGIIRHIYTMRQ